MATVASIAAGSSVATGGGVSVLMRWLHSKEAQQNATRIALMEQQLTAVVSTLQQLVEAETARSYERERIALLERDVQAIHKRLDGRPNRK